MGEKLKSENMQKKNSFLCLCYFLRAISQADVENGAILTTYLLTYTSECTIFRSRIFTIFFASGGKGALTPLTKILRTFLSLSYTLPHPAWYVCRCVRQYIHTGELGEPIDMPFSSLAFLWTLTLLKLRPYGAIQNLQICSLLLLLLLFYTPGSKDPRS